MLTLLAPAKINLSLDVTGKLNNGYHVLETIMQTISLYDEVSLEKTERGIEIECDNPLVPVDENNICYKAAKIFLQRASCYGGAKISIKKIIPVSAGLAGGSSDAAAVIEGLNKLYEKYLPMEKLKQFGAECGADVPYCLTGGTCLAQGIGDRITKLKSIPVTHLVLIVPEFPVSTAWVYQNYRAEDVIRHPDTGALIECLHKGDVLGLVRGMENVLESVTVTKYPEIEGIKGALKKRGAIGTLMSGSGPSVFGFFESQKAALKALSALKRKHKQIFKAYTVNGGRIYVEAIKDKNR